MTSDLADMSRPKRAFVARWRRWLQVRRVDLVPERADRFAPTAALLRPVGRLPERSVVLTFTAADDDPDSLRVFAHDRHGRGRLVHEVPHLSHGRPTRRVLNLPTQLTDLYVVDPRRARTFSGGVRALELGQVPMVIWLGSQRLRSPAERDRREPTKVARKAIEVLKRGGVKGILERMIASHAVRVDPGASRTANHAAPITSSREPDSAPLELLQAHQERADRELDELLAGTSRLALPTVAAGQSPDVTVVLVTWGGAALALRTLRSLQLVGGVSFEVVIVDNASTDRCRDMLERVEGATVLLNSSNVGFQRACNQAATAAVGEYLLLLNPDAEVTESSISAAVEAARGTGAWVVGGPVVAVDGLLQEAGGIIWADGTCEGFGRGLNPDRDEFRYRRPVDFVSGVFLLTRRDRWAQLGGLDERFHPAYYEDVDYCARVWEARGTVIYEPDARVVHVEHGTVESTTRAREMMRERRDVFQSLHEDFLTGQEPHDRLRRLHACVRDRHSPRVLIVDDRVPFSDEGSGAPRMLALVRALADEGARVTFFAKLLPTGGQRDPHTTLPRDVEAIVGRGLAELTGFLREREGVFDTVIISRPANMAEVVELLDADPSLLADARLVYDAEAIEAYRNAGEATLQGQPWTDRQLSDAIEQEVSLASQADIVLAVSEGEAKSFARHGCGQVAVLAHSVTARTDTPGRSERDSILFVGNLRYSTLPNVDGLMWFLDEVVPVLRARLTEIGRECPDVRVVGRIGEETGALLRRDGVALLGAVDDLTGEYDRAAVFVASTRYGAGIPIKVVEAAANGVPVVATRILVEQLGWPSATLRGVDADPSEFAQELVELLSNQEAWQRQRHLALEIVAARWSTEAFRDAIRGVLGWG